jgi:hypothetical protein
MARVVDVRKRYFLIEKGVGEVRELIPCPALIALHADILVQLGERHYILNRTVPIWNEEEEAGDG